MSISIPLPEGVDQNTGTYTSFIYTVVDTLFDKGVVHITIVSGDNITDDVIGRHHETVKQLIINGFNTHAVVKH